MSKCKWLLLPLAIFLLTSLASAEPLLQLYMQGGTFDPVTETWTVTTTGTFNIWALGNVAGPGGKGAISGVHLSAAYAHPDSGSVTVNLQSTTAAGYKDFFDPSIPIDAFLIGTPHEDGSVPRLFDGTYLPSHGEYGPGVDWQEFDLGNFTLTDSPCADFSGVTNFPAVSTNSGCQLNVYTVAVTGTGAIHFDLYDHIQASTKAKAKTPAYRSVFAPFSHDAESSTVPEPGSLALLGSGLIAVGGLLRRKLVRR